MDEFSQISQESEFSWLIRLMWEYWQNEHPDRPAMDFGELPHFFTEMKFAYDNYKCGNWLALLDCLQVCRDNDIALPEWASAGLQTFVIESVLGSTHGSKGRANSPAAKARESLKRHKRYETVRLIRLAQKMQKQDDDLIYALAVPNETKKLINAGKISGIGNTVKEAVAVAEQSLRGTYAQASAVTILRIFRSYSEDEFMVSYETQVALGLADDDLPPKFGGYEFLSIDDIVEQQQNSDKK
jgi:hypothetical protein